MEELKKLLKVMVEEMELRQVISTQEVMIYLNQMETMLQEIDWVEREKKMSKVSKLREEYFLLNGKKAYLGWKEGELEVKIAEKRDSMKMSDGALRSKKTEWKK